MGDDQRGQIPPKQVIFGDLARLETRQHPGEGDQDCRRNDVEPGLIQQ
jgi:hypothetical protein